VFSFSSSLGGYNLQCVGGIGVRGAPLIAFGFGLGGLKGVLDALAESSHALNTTTPPKFATFEKLPIFHLNSSSRLGIVDLNMPNIVVLG
jgi:hypothetical protein